MFLSILYGGVLLPGTWLSHIVVHPHDVLDRQLAWVSSRTSLSLKMDWLCDVFLGSGGGPANESLQKGVIINVLACGDVG